MSKRLYVGNLSYSCTEEDLLQAFVEFQGTNPRIVENRGFGFVDVPDETMDAAISKWDGQQFQGRTLRVNEARPREDRPRTGGGGGYGGGGGGGSFGGGGRSGGGGGFGGGRSGGGGDRGGRGGGGGGRGGDRGGRGGGRF